MAEKLPPCSVRLTASSVDEVDRMAKASGTSRSEILRMLVEEALAARANEAEASDVQFVTAANWSNTLVDKLEEAVGRLASWTPPAPELPAEVTELVRRLDRHLDDDRSHHSADAILALLKTITRRLADSAERLDGLASLRAELAGVPDQVELLTNVLIENRPKTQESFANEIRRLREQTASMLAILHSYRMNGTEEAAETFARPILD